MKIKSRQFLEFFGLVAVVISLLLVAYELRQSNLQSSANILIELMNEYSTYDQLIFENEEAAALLSSLRHPDTELNPVEYERVRGLGLRHMNIWGAQEFAFERGLIPVEQFQITLVEIESSLNDFPRLRPVFRDILEFNPAVEYLEFAIHLDSELKSYGE